MSTLTKHAKIPLRLMPLGGSITYGQCSSDGNGYRKHLRDLLVQDGYDVTMVGSRQTGSMINNDHEGWRGYRVDQVANKAARSVPRFKPDLFAVNAGSNDCLQWFEMGGFERRMENLLDLLWQGELKSATFRLITESSLLTPVGS